MKSDSHENVVDICIVIFKEHPVINYLIEEPGTFDISTRGTLEPADFTLEGIFCLPAYCTQIIRKIDSLPAEEILSFIQYQCRQMKNPDEWLFQLGKLLECNSRFFIANSRISMLANICSLIEQERSRLKQLQTPFQYHFAHPWNAYHITFQQIKGELDKIEPFEEKMALLIKCKIEYLQNEPPFISKYVKPLNELIDLEIEKLKQIRELLPQKKDKGKDLPSEKRIPASQKIRFNAQINILADIFYQIKNELSINDKPYINASIQEITDLITNNFLDKDGNEISPSTVRTILSPNRPEKRPKQDKRISLKESK